jgi:quercetin dioxygenase-like cupin family protein
MLRRLIPFLLAIATLVPAQAAPEVEITAEPHHHLILENKSVRVFYVDVPTNDSTLIHRHRHDYIYVTLGASAIVNSIVGKPSITGSMQDGDTQLAPAPFAHSVKTVSATPFRNVTIELLEDAKLRQDAQSNATHWDETRGLDILNGGTKEILFVKDGVRVTEYELQPGRNAPTPQGAYLIVPVSSLHLEASDRPVNAPRDAWSTVAMDSGEAAWVPPGHFHSVTNAGHSPAKFITLEFP